ncbi:MAG: thioredoxin family protein [Gammaproteobacteria bacterium]|nr:thioredoxin family protein [Gammaproteobacteria bacterium]MDD9959931.1 thioredoxin family protein [Gammaproteobacteria bacterium]
MNQSTANRITVVIKKDCPTCALIEPVLAELVDEFENRIAIYVQDDPAFPQSIRVKLDDTSLEFSYANKIEIVPTLICSNDEEELGRTVGWDKSEWRQLTGLTNLGNELVDFKPGCGSKTQDPGMEEILAAQFEKDLLQARKVELAQSEDEIEACFDRGWSDGLPVVPPTVVRVIRMLKATNRAPDEVIGNIPPNNLPCTIEKVAINAVLAGCKPEYLPVVLASVEAALQDKFCMHGLLCTTYFSGPVMIVNGPVIKKIGMNSGVNALGQGNRANASIGRALQLLIRNVGGGVPGGIDRAVMGNPGKYTYCFAEDESDEDWTNLAQDRGYERTDSVINLFAGEGLQAIVDQQSRAPESLTKNIANSLRSVVNTKMYGAADAILVVSPEHRRVFRQAGWTKQDLREALYDNLMIAGSEVIRGADDIAEGMPVKFKDKLLNKFRDDGLHIVTTGGSAGMFSAIISGWVASGEKGSQLVSQKIQ